MTVAIEGVGVVCKIISSFSCWETLIHWSKASNFSKFSWLVNDYSLLLCSRNFRFLCWRIFSRKKRSKCFTCWERSDSFRVNDHIKRRHWGDKKETRWSGSREKKESQDEILNSSNKRWERKREWWELGGLWLPSSTCCLLVRLQYESCRAPHLLKYSFSSCSSTWYFKVLLIF